MSSKTYTDLTWDDVLSSLGEKPTILLGNGLSIACDRSFFYNNLLARAVEEGLPEQVEALFAHLDTANFEQVMQILDEAARISGLYGCACTSRDLMLGDVERTKEALIQAVTKVHGNYPTQKALEEDRKLACVEFLRRFHLVCTLNYDFLLYWVWQRGREDLAWSTGDGFRSTEGVFTGLENGGIRFLHGALHLFVERGVTMKHHYKTHTPLLDQVRVGLDHGRYPLFIAEGSDAKKRVGIGRSDYLSACFREFERVGPDLVVYGSSLGPSDNHLVEAIIRNPKLERVYVGSHDDPTPELEAVLKRIATKRASKGGGGELETLALYRSDGIAPWG